MSQHCNKQKVQSLVCADVVTDSTLPLHAEVLGSVPRVGSILVVGSCAQMLPVHSAVMCGFYFVRGELVWPPCADVTRNCFMCLNY